MSDDQRFAHVLSFVGTATPTRADGQIAQKDMHVAQNWPELASHGLWQVLAAHVIELRRAEVIDDAAMVAIASAMATVADQSVSAQSMGLRERAGGIEARIEHLLPSGVAGVVTLGLSREEWLATTTRLTWRSLLLDVVAGYQALIAEVLRLAEVHVVTIMPAHLGGRAAQPTTLAHYLGGLLGPLHRSQGRVVAAWSGLNRSPLGAGMLAGDVVAADRGDEAERLGFDGLIPNTLDAVASVEDYVEVLDAFAAGISPVARFVREIAVWIRTDPTSFVLDEPWLSLPEPAHPALQLADRLDRLQDELEQASDLIDRLRRVLRRMTYGPLGSHHDVVGEMVPALRDMLLNCVAHSSALFTEGLIVNRAYLGNRAGRDYTTATDLAAFLMTEEQIPPASARRISVLVLSGLKERGLEVSGITPDMIDSAALMTIGREIKVEMEALGRFLAPRRYIERRQVTGSPAPDMSREWLSLEREQFDQYAAWHSMVSAQTASALRQLEQSIRDTAADSLEQ